MKEKVLRCLIINLKTPETAVPAHHSLEVVSVVVSTVVVAVRARMATVAVLAFC